MARKALESASAASADERSRDRLSKSILRGRWTPRRPSSHAPPEIKALATLRVVVVDLAGLLRVEEIRALTWLLLFAQRPSGARDLVWIQ